MKVNSNDRLIHKDLLAYLKAKLVPFRKKKVDNKLNSTVYVWRQSEMNKIKSLLKKKKILNFD